jgi:hypothetical protein
MAKDLSPLTLPFYETGIFALTFTLISLNFASLLDTTEHLFETGFIKPDHHLIARSNHGDTSSARNFYHLI